MRFVDHDGSRDGCLPGAGQLLITVPAWLPSRTKVIPFKIFWYGGCATRASPDGPRYRQAGGACGQGVEGSNPRKSSNMSKLPPHISPLVTEGADELMARNLPPVRMVVGDVIPAGLLLLAGDPKVGKSLVLQHLALSAALGEPAWGSLPLDGGSALYLALEGGQRSFRSRLDAMLGGKPAPSALRVTYGSNRLGAGLEEQLDAWLDERRDARLTVIDTYSSVAPEARGVNRHQEDYNALAGLASLTNAWPDILVVAVHHTRKAEGDDVMHRISGSQGMTAATDGNAVLARHTAASQCVLSVRPRNAEENELVLQRDNSTLRWSMVGADERAQLSGGRQRILAHMERHPGGCTPKQVADELEMTPANARKYLSEMSKVRQVVRNEHGLYTLLSKAEDAA